MENSRWYSFFWVFGVLMFGSNISDMIGAKSLDYQFIILGGFAFAAWLSGLYRRYRKIKHAMNQ